MDPLTIIFISLSELLFEIGYCLLIRDIALIKVDQSTEIFEPILCRTKLSHHQQMKDYPSPLSGGSGFTPIPISTFQPTPTTPGKKAIETIINDINGCNDDNNRRIINTEISPLSSVDNGIVDDGPSFCENQQIVAVSPKPATTTTKATTTTTTPFARGDSKYLSMLLRRQSPQAESSVDESPMTTLDDNDHSSLLPSFASTHSPAAKMDRRSRDSKYLKMIQAYNVPADSSGGGATTTSTTPTTTNTNVSDKPSPIRSNAMVAVKQEDDIDGSGGKTATITQGRGFDAGSIVDIRSSGGKQLNQYFLSIMDVICTKPKKSTWNPGNIYFDKLIDETINCMLNQNFGAVPQLVDAVSDGTRRRFCSLFIPRTFPRL